MYLSLICFFWNNTRAIAKNSDNHTIRKHALQKESELHVTPF